MKYNRMTIANCIKSAMPLLLAFLLGAMFYSICIYFSLLPHGWLLTEKLSIQELSDAEKRKVFELVLSGQIISASTLLEQIMGYYHFLVSLLFGVITLMAGFIAYKNIKSRQEHDEALKNRMNILFKNLEAEDGLQSLELSDYENLQAFLREKVSVIVEQSVDIAYYKDQVEDAVITILDQILVREIETLIREKGMQVVDQYCDSKLNNKDTE